MAKFAVNWEKNSFESNFKSFKSLWPYSQVVTIPKVKQKKECIFLGNPFITVWFVNTL